jgi:hypothetical protein
MEAIFAVGAASVAVRLLAGRSALVSFAFMRPGSFLSAASVAKLCEVCPRVVLDSGAFSAWKQGTPIDLGAYLAHIEEHGHRYAWIAALDAIGDWRASVANWSAMLDRLPADLAAKVVPVFHEGEPMSVLETYCDRAPFVGLGRTDGRKDDPKELKLTKAFYDACFNEREHAYHAFGCSNPNAIELYPFKSFDSTTWERNAAFTEKYGWPVNRCSRETMMRVYIEAMSTMKYTPRRAAVQADMEDLFDKFAATETSVRVEGEDAA